MDMTVSYLGVVFEFIGSINSSEETVAPLHKHGQCVSNIVKTRQNSGVLEYLCQSARMIARRKKALQFWEIQRPFGWSTLSPMHSRHFIVFRQAEGDDLVKRIKTESAHRTELHASCRAQTVRY